jgi:O-glycosyl hydrolase
MCADLVTQLVAKCCANRGTKYAALSEVQILERLLGQLIGTGWGTEAEIAWVVRETASCLDWPIPNGAAALKTMLGESA